MAHSGGYEYHTGFGDNLFFVFQPDFYLPTEVVGAGGVVTEEADNLVMFMGMGLVIDSHGGFEIPGSVHVKSPGNDVLVHPENASGVFIIDGRHFLSFFRLLKLRDDGFAVFRHEIFSFLMWIGIL